MESQLRAIKTEQSIRKWIFEKWKDSWWWDFRYSREVGKDKSEQELEFDWLVWCIFRLGVSYCNESVEASFLQRDNSHSDKLSIKRVNIVFSSGCYIKTNWSRRSRWVAWKMSQVNVCFYWAQTNLPQGKWPYSWIDQRTSFYLTFTHHKRPLAQTNSDLFKSKLSGRGSKRLDWH